MSDGKSIWERLNPEWDKPLASEITRPPYAPRRRTSSETRSSDAWRVAFLAVNDECTALLGDLLVVEEENARLREALERIWRMGDISDACREAVRALEPNP